MLTNLVKQMPQLAFSCCIQSYRIGLIDLKIFRRNSIRYKSTIARKRAKSLWMLSKLLLGLKSPICFIPKCFAAGQTAQT